MNCVGFLYLETISNVILRRTQYCSGGAGVLRFSFFEAWPLSCFLHIYISVMISENLYAASAFTYFIDTSRLRLKQKQLLEYDVVLIIQRSMSFEEEACIYESV